MFNPENDLERALVQAAEDPAARVPFLKMLLDGELSLALIDSGGASGAGYEVPEVTHEDASFVPVFSADSRVGSMFGREKMMIVRQSFRQIIEQMDGANFVLNPGSDYGREVYAEDVAAMLKGDFEAAAETDDFEPGQGDEDGEDDELPKAVGRATPAPTHLTKPLARLFATLPQVRTAHIAQAIFESPDGIKRLVMGVSTEPGSDVDDVFDRIGEVLDEVARPSDVIDFVPVPGSPLDGYFERDAAPFYRKT